MQLAPPHRQTQLTCTRIPCGHRAQDGWHITFECPRHSSIRREHRQDQSTWEELDQLIWTETEDADYTHVVNMNEEDYEEEKTDDGYYKSERVAVEWKTQYYSGSFLDL